MVFTWSRVSDRAHDSTCSIWHQATEDTVRYFTCFSLLKRSIHSELFQQNLSWQCPAIIAPCLVVVSAGERRGSVFGSCLWQKTRRTENEIKKTRDMDPDFREQIKKDRVYTCEKHFAPEDIEICEYGFFFLHNR